MQLSGMGEGLSNQPRPRTCWQKSCDKLLNLALPQDCQLCGAMDAGDLLCAPCLADLSRLPSQRCPVCALPAPDGTICGECLRHPPHFDATLAPFAYTFPLDQLVHAFKYAHHLALARLFARLMRTATLKADLIVALPLSKERLRERGFNQALEVAKLLSWSSGIPLDRFGTSRVTDTVAQASLPWKERRANVRHAFECTIDLGGKTVIVVDDVMTTGASLDEFARTLKYHGAAGVTNCVLARTLKHES